MYLVCLAVVAIVFLWGRKDRVRDAREKGKQECFREFLWYIFLVCFFFLYLSSCMSKSGVNLLMLYSPVSSTVNDEFILKMLCVSYLLFCVVFKNVLLSKKERKKERREMILCSGCVSNFTKDLPIKLYNVVGNIWQWRWNNIKTIKKKTTKIQ